MRQGSLNRQSKSYVKEMDNRDAFGGSRTGLSLQSFLFHKKGFSFASLAQNCFCQDLTFIFNVQLREG
jgi:hypothetical protein